MNNSTTKKKVAILFGGCSTEYGISLKSASIVIENLDSEKYDIILIGITREGQWLRFGGSIDKIKDDTWFEDDSCIPTIISPSRTTHGLIEFNNKATVETKIDIVFPVLHGKNGEDGTVQGLLELAGIPYVGCGVMSSAICMDKDIAHVLANHAGIKTPNFIASQDIHNIDQVISDAESLGYPMFIKPANAGSSIGITKAHSKEELRQGIETAFLHDSKIVIEENIEGFEVGCAILGNRDLMIGTVDEIEITTDFFDFKEKYSLANSRIILPARIDDELSEKVKKTALKLYEILGCKGLARIDMFINRSGEIVFNEVNSLPGLTAGSRYPNMLKSIGLSYCDIIDRLISLSEE